MSRSSFKKGLENIKSYNVEGFEYINFLEICIKLAFDQLYHKYTMDTFDKA